MLGARRVTRPLWLDANVIISKYKLRLSRSLLSPHSLLSQLKMKFLVRNIDYQKVFRMLKYFLCQVALSLFSTSLAAPLPEADPQLLTYNNLQPAAPFTTQPIISYAHQPLAVANFASPTGTTRTYNQPPVTSYARPVVHQVQTVATAPVVHHVGYKVLLLE